MNDVYDSAQPARADIDSTRGPLLLVFGTNWCGYCRGAQPLIEQAAAEHPGVKRLQVEDGSGRPLGRSFGIKLWPSLVFLRDGVEVDRLVRPGDAASISAALAKL